MVDETTIQEAGRRLLRAAPSGTRVILFGSHARGTAGRHSDLDFLVIEPVVEDSTDESVRLRRTLRGLLVAADVIVVSADDVKNWRGVRSSLIGTALAEGRELASDGDLPGSPSRADDEGVGVAEGIVEVGSRVVIQHAEALRILADFDRDGSGI